MGGAPGGGRLAGEEGGTRAWPQHSPPSPSASLAVSVQGAPASHVV